MVERAVQRWEGMVRTLKLDLGQRDGCEIDKTWAVWDWLLEPAFALITRYHVSQKKKLTVVKLIHGKAAVKPICRIGEKVLSNHSKAIYDN